MPVNTGYRWEKIAHHLFLPSVLVKPQSHPVKPRQTNMAPDFRLSEFREVHQAGSGLIKVNQASIKAGSPRRSLGAKAGQSMAILSIA
jgi:hypothetical protein